MPATSQGDVVIMEPISTALAGIALVKASVDGIKSALGTAKDIGAIANDIDALLNGQAQVQVASNKKAGVGLADQFGVQSVAKEMIDAKIAAEHVAEVRRLTDHRFGAGTWQSILDERAKRIKEAKAAQLEARRMAQLRHDEMVENMKIGLAIFALVVVVVGLFIAVMVSTAGAIGLA
jgi:hypothetical protein